MINNTIPFTVKAMGYDQDQVDKFFQKVSREYENLHRGYTELSKKYDGLLRRSNNHIGSFAETLTETENDAKKIIEDAKKRASELIWEAYQDLKIVQHDKEMLICEMNEIATNLKSMGIGN